MELRTADEYLAGLNHGRHIRQGGEVVPDAVQLVANLSTSPAGRERLHVPEHLRP